MMTRRRVLLAILVLLLLIGGGYGLYSRHEEVKTQEKIDKISKLGEEWAKESAERLVRGEFPRFDQQQERAKEIRDALRELPEEQRREKGMEIFFNFMATNADAVLKQPKEKQDQIFDAVINGMELARRLRGNQPPRPPRDDAQNGGDNAGPNGGQGPRRPRTQEEKERRFKHFLDSTTPEGRAKVFTAMQLFNERRVARGFPPLEFGRRRNRDRNR